jgi:hypothetical protein
MEQLFRYSHIMYQRVTKDEIEDIIKSIKSWKAPGEDNISIGLFKACGKLLHKTLAALVISSFNAAYFPCRFKIAKVIVLLKPNKIIVQKATLGAWRPILLLVAAVAQQCIEEGVNLTVWVETRVYFKILS